MMRLMVAVRELTGAGSRRIDDRAFRQLQRDRPEAAAVGRDARIGDGAQRVAGSPPGCPTARQLNGPRTCGLEPVKSTVMAPSPTVTATSMRMRLVELDAVVVEKVDGAVGALRNRAQGLARHGLRSIEQLGEDRGELVVAVGIGQRGQPAHADRAGRDLRHQIAFERLRDAHVAPQDLQQRVVELRPPSRSFSGGSRMPSWNISVALVGTEPGVMPPTSW